MFQLLLALEQSSSAWHLSECITGGIGDWTFVHCFFLDFLSHSWTLDVISSQQGFICYRIRAACDNVQSALRIGYVVVRSFLYVAGNSPQVIPVLQDLSFLRGLCHHVLVI